MTILIRNLRTQLPSIAADARVVTQSGVCTAGCDLDAAAAGQITDSTLWTFTGANYAVSVTGGSLDPWAGYWLVTQDAAQPAGPTLLMPKP